MKTRRLVLVLALSTTALGLLATGCELERGDAGSSPWGTTTIPGEGDGLEFGVAREVSDASAQNRRGRYKSDDDWGSDGWDIGSCDDDESEGGPVDATTTIPSATTSAPPATVPPTTTAPPPTATYPSADGRPTPTYPTSN